MSHLTQFPAPLDNFEDLYRVLRVHWEGQG